MANANPKGVVRPTSGAARAYQPSSEILLGLLTELEAAADLVEQLLVHGPDPDVLAAVQASLRELAGLLEGGRS